jgi:UDP-glucose 4-epimerase
VRYLVTGGAGFIGSHLVRRLLAEKHEVIVLDDFSTSRRTNLALETNSHLGIVDGSVLDRRALAEASRGADFIFHLAAAVGVFNIVEHPIKSLRTNIIGTENVLELAREMQIPVLCTSSSEVYGKNISDSLSEDDDRVLGSPAIARWSYSEAKAIDEFMALAYLREYGLQTRVVRLFNTVGAGQLGSYGMVIPRFVSAALLNSDIEIYGTGDQTRCFTHVEDVVEALMKISNSVNTVGEIINIGNTNEISIKKLAEKIISMTNSTSKIVFKEYNEVYDSKFEDMQRRVPNIQKITRLVGWSPMRNLEDIIRDVIEHEKNG